MSVKLFVLLLLPVLGYSIERFSCRGRILGGYYADASSGCRAFHVCVRVAGGGVRDFRFRCPPGTLFHREAQTCADWGDDAGDVGCPDELDDGQFDLYRIGSGFESKKSTYSEPPPPPEDEPEFALQRAETGDRRLHQNTQQSQSSNDLRASHSSDFFSGRRDRGRDDTPAPVAPSSTYAPVTRGNYRRPSQRTHIPTTTTTQAPVTTQQPSIEPYKRKLIRKRPVYNASQFSTAASSFTSSQTPVTPVYLDINAKYSETSQQSSSQNYNNDNYNIFNGNPVTPKSYKSEQVQHYNPVTSKNQHSHAPAPVPAPANDVIHRDDFNKQPNHDANKNSNYYNAPTGSTSNNYNNANRQHSANNDNYNNNYDTNQKYYDTTDYNKIKATVRNSYNVASIETENVNYNNGNNNKANLDVANTNYKNSNSANYKKIDNPSNNNVNYNSANYNNDNYKKGNNNENYNNANGNNLNYNNNNANGNNLNYNNNNANGNNLNYDNNNNDNANYDTNINANYNQVKKVPLNNPSQGNSANYNIHKVEVSSNGNQNTASTPGYTAQKHNTQAYTAPPKKLPSSSAYSSPAPVSAYTSPRVPSSAPYVNTIAYNTNAALDARAPTFAADNEEDDGQYRLPSGEDDGQYRPELYERELLSGAHSLNIAASGNRLPEDQRPRAKPHKHVTASPSVSSVPPGPPAPRPFSLASPQTPKPFHFQPTSAAPQFISTASQTPQPVTSAPVAVSHAQTQRPVAVTYVQTQRPVAVTHIPSTTYTAPKESYSKPQGFSPKTASSVSPPHKHQTPHKVKSDEGKKLSSLSKPIKNPKEDTSYDYAYYDSSDPYSEYENIEEFGKTHIKH